MLLWCGSRKKIHLPIPAGAGTKAGSLGLTIYLNSGPSSVAGDVKPPSERVSQLPGRRGGLWDLDRLGRMFLEVNSWDRRRNTKKLVRQIALFKSCQADLGGRRESEVGSNERTNERTEGALESAGLFSIQFFLLLFLHGCPLHPCLASPNLWGKKSARIIRSGTKKSVVSGLMGHW